MKKSSKKTTKAVTNKIAPKVPVKATKKTAGVAKTQAKAVTKTAAIKSAATKSAATKAGTAGKSAKIAQPSKSPVKTAVKSASGKAIAKPKKAVKSVVKPVEPTHPVKPTKPTKQSRQPKTTSPAEKGLTAAEIESYRTKLLMIRARLRGDVTTMTDAALNKNRMDPSGDVSSMPIHMADVGSDNFEQEQTLAFMQSESGILDMVEEALQRIKQGAYGICESCETWIPKVRLNFIPYASMCVKCATIAQEERN